MRLEWAYLLSTSDISNTCFLVFMTDAVSHFINENHRKQEHCSFGVGFPDSSAGLVRFGL